MASISNSANKRPAKDSDSDLSEDEAPLTKRPKPSNGKSAANDDSSDDDDDDDAPLAKATSNGKTNGKKPDEDEMDVDEDSSSPVKKGTSTEKPASTSSNRKRSAPVKAESEDSDDEPLSQKVIGKSSSNSKKSTPAKKQKKSATPEGSDDDEDDDGEDDDDDDDDEGDEEEGDKSTKKEKKPSGDKKGGSSKKLDSGRGGRKWNTLYHTGPRFPEEYTPLPSDVMLNYDGKSVPLPPEAEEAAMFYAQKLETQHARGETFNKNFFEDFQKVLKKHPAKDGTKIEKFANCDFRPMYNYWKGMKDAEADRKKGLAPSARKDELEKKKKMEAEMKTCIVDGEEQKVGNVMAEPPSLFLGRGAHPKTGHIKARIRPEDITINHTLGDKDHPPPEPPAGHKWKAVIQNNDVTWLAYWQENINGQYKYMYLDATSNFKTNSDRDKYEKARKLDKCIKKLRAKVDENLSSKNRPERQIATVVWLIDNYSLRAGNEKGDDEAATYGACSLLVEHATLIEPTDLENDPKWVVKLSFLGKDSMKFEERLEMPQRVWNNFKMFMRSSGKNEKTGEPLLKKGSDPIFHCIDTGAVNNFIQDPANGGMKGLSAKVFRTYNASTTFQGLLNRTEEWLSERKNPEERILNFNNLKLAYNEANRQVAILCNHQKTVNPVAHEKTMQKTEDKMFAIRYDRHKELQKLLTHHTEAELKKNYTGKEYDFAKKWSTILEPVKLKTEDIKAHEEAFIEAKKQRIRNTFDKAEKEKAYQAEKKEKETEDLSKKGKKVKQQAEEEENGTSARKGPKTKAELNDLLKELDDQLKVLAKERKTNKSTSENCNVPSTCKKILGKVEALKKQKSELANKENTKEVSLGTSKLNYIDPRVTLAWLKKFDNKLLAQKEAEENKGSSKKKGGKKAVKKEEDDEEDLKPSKGSKKGKGKAKKEDSDDDEDEKPLSKGKGKGKATLNADPDEVEARTKDKAKERGNKNTTGTSEKMELGLKIMPIGNFFPMTMQKKFKWAATDDDGKDLSPDWVFVEDAVSKMRTMSSAIKDNAEVKKEKKKEGAFRPHHKAKNEPDYDE